MCCVRLIHNWLMISLVVVVGGGGGTKRSRRSTVVNAAVALAFFSASSTRENYKNMALVCWMFSFSQDFQMTKPCKNMVQNLCYTVKLYHMFGV